MLVATMRPRLCIVLGFAITTGLGLGACGDNSGNEVRLGPYCDAWHQWGNDASHAGASCVRGQPLHSALADMIYDPFIESEFVDARGDVIVHYQAPLIDGDDLYMMTRSSSSSRSAPRTRRPRSTTPAACTPSTTVTWSSSAINSTASRTHLSDRPRALTGSPA